MRRQHSRIAAINVLTVALSSPVLSQTQLTPHPGPILGRGSPGAWDEHLVFLPEVVVHEGVFYLFYTGWNVDFLGSIGLATSTDGIHFVRHPDNPILTPDGTGWDAAAIGNQTVLLEGGVWVMYFGGSVDPSPGPYLGRATATSPAGPWTRDPLEEPVLGIGGTGEWDSGFAIPESIVRTSAGYELYYGAGENFFSGLPRSSGLARSVDGLNWIKHDDPTTTVPPFAESDPVLTGTAGSWDSTFAWAPSIVAGDCRRSIYFGGDGPTGPESIGFARSSDGVVWTRHTANPVLTPAEVPWADAVLPGSTVLHGGTYYLYFWGSMTFPLGASIGVATAPIDDDDDANDNGRPDVCECIADLDGSGAVGLSDLTILLSNFGSIAGPEDGDLNGDGVVGLADLALFLSNFGLLCP